MSPRHANAARSSCSCKVKNTFTRPAPALQCLCAHELLALDGYTPGLFWAGHVKLVEHEEIIAAGWDDEFCWGGSKNDAHKQGAWELLLASTGTRMRPKAVAKALQDAETPPHMHGHSKPHHSHAHSRSHTHKLQGGHSGESSSEEDLLGQFAPQHVHSSESFHSVHHSAPPGSNSSRSSQGTLSISSNSSSSCTAEDGMLHAHHVWLATGSVVDVRAEPVFSGLMAVAPVPVHGGMPMLQEDLRCACSSMAMKMKVVFLGLMAAALVSVHGCKNI
eukprot:scaffold81611_cov17-Tisochrysis_lutea.AAC.1